jgi:hypothetical protein
VREALCKSGLSQFPGLGVIASGGRYLVMNKEEGKQQFVIQQTSQYLR